MSNLYRQDEERAKMAKRISGIEKLLIASSKMFSQQHEELRGDNVKKVETLKDDWQHVDDKLQEFKLEIHQSVLGVQEEISLKVKDARLGIDGLTDIISKLSSDVTVLCERDYAAMIEAEKQAKQAKQEQQQKSFNIGRVFRREPKADIRESKADSGAKVPDTSESEAKVSDTTAEPDESVPISTDGPTPQLKDNIEPQATDPKSTQGTTTDEPSPTGDTSSPQQPTSTDTPTDDTVLSDDKPTTSEPSRPRYSGPFAEVINKIFHDWDKK